MRWLITGLILVLIGCSGTEENRPASLSVETAIDTTVGYIGDIFHYEIQVKGLNGKYVTQQEFFPPGGEKRSQNSYRENDTHHFDFEIVYWDTGQQVIPPQELKVYNADSTLYGTFKTDPVFITVGSLLANDNSPSLKPIKPPVPVSRKPDVKRIAAGIIIFLLLVGIYWVWHQREITRKKIIATKYFVPPDRQALDRLAALKKNRNGDIKEWYTDLSYALREYIENSFYIRALEMTTDEIIRHQHLLPVQDSLVQDFIRILQKADQVKYAKAIPDRQQMDSDIDTGIRFIEHTSSDWKPDTPPQS